MKEEKVSIDNWITWCKEMKGDMECLVIMAQAVRSYLRTKTKTGVNGRRTILSNMTKIIDFFSWRVGYLERKLTAVEDAKSKRRVRKAFERAVTILKEDELKEEAWRKK